MKPSQEKPSTVTLSTAQNVTDLMDCVPAADQDGGSIEVYIPKEIPLLIKVDGREVITLMTLGSFPEALAVGYLRNQYLIEKPQDISAVQMDWQTETVNVTTRSGRGIPDMDLKLRKRVLASSCGEGTLLSRSLEICRKKPPSHDVSLLKSTLQTLLKRLKPYNTIYRTTGSVHGCGLCRRDKVEMFIEDVGRHNAADTISGMMYLQGISGRDALLYTTGRLTAEIVMKAAAMEIPFLVSRSGTTSMGLEMAQELGITLIGRAKANRFVVYTGIERVVFNH